MGTKLVARRYCYSKDNQLGRGAEIIYQSPSIHQSPELNEHPVHYTSHKHPDLNSSKSTSYQHRTATYTILRRDNSSRLENLFGTGKHNRTIAPRMTGPKISGPCHQVLLRLLLPTDFFPLCGSFTRTR